VPIAGRGLPVTLVIAGRSCLVVGGGEVARRKARTLLDAGAEVLMVAPEFTAAASALAARHERRRYEPGEAGRYHLVIAATGVAEVDHLVANDAEAAGVLVNTADDPEYCSFIYPAVHRVGSVTVAVATDGTSPALASVLRDELAELLGDGPGELAGRLGAIRAELIAAGVPTEGRDWRGLIEALRSAEDPDSTAAAWLQAQLAGPSRTKIAATAE
jgi:siroheme synthase-like protein